MSVNGAVLLYTFVLSVGAGILFGLAPAWSVARPVIVNALKGEDVLARPGRVWSLRNLLVVAQISMSLVLLCATGLFLRSLGNASRIDIGFRSKGVLMMSVDPRLHGYSPERSIQLLNQLRDRVAAFRRDLLGIVHRRRAALRRSSQRAVSSRRADRLRLETPVTSISTWRVPAISRPWASPRVAGRDFEQRSRDVAQGRRRQ